MLGRVEVVRVFMTAEEIDGVAADAETGTRNEALVDCIANRGIGRAGALGAHVAFRGKSGEQVGLRSLLGKDDAPGNGFLNGLQVLDAGMKKEVNVCVDEAGHQGSIAKIHDFGVVGMFDARPDGANAIPLNEHFAGLQDLAGIDVKKTRRVKDDGWRVWLLRIGGNLTKKNSCRYKDQERGLKTGSFSRILHRYEYAARGQVLSMMDSIQRPRLRAMSLGCRRRYAIRADGGAGQVDDEGCTLKSAAMPIGPDANAAAVPAHDLHCHPEPQPRAHILLCGEEGVEDAIEQIGMNARPIVFNDDLGHFACWRSCASAAYRKGLSAMSCARSSVRELRSTMA